MNNKIIGKLICEDQLIGTCFLINELYVITAYHVIQDKSNIEINFKFIKDKRSVNNIYFFDENTIDFAILELDKKIETDINYMTLGTITPVEQCDFWETIGYSDEYEDDEYIYLNGTVNRYIEKEVPDLELNISDQKEISEWEGISGAPLIVNKQISGIILRERFSKLKTKLKAISVEKIIEFLHNKPEVLKILSFKRRNLLTERINTFTQECEDKFFLFKYEEQTFKSNCLILKQMYNIDDIIEIIDLFLKDYANSLQEIIDTQDNSMIVRRKKQREIESVSQELKKLLIKNNKIGLVILWIILEGSFQAPRIASTYSVINEDIKQDIYLFKSSNNIKMSIGYAEMQKNILDSISKILSEIDREIKNRKEQSKIFIWDELAINYLDINDRLKVRELVEKEQSGTEIELEIIILHSYDSEIYEKGAYKSNYDNSKIVERICRYELDSYNHKIAQICSKYEWIKLKQISWVSLPLSSLEAFNKKFQY